MRLLHMGGTYRGWIFYGGMRYAAIYYNGSILYTRAATLIAYTLVLPVHTTVRPGLPLRPQEPWKVQDHSRMEASKRLSPD